MDDIAWELVSDDYVSDEGKFCPYCKSPTVTVLADLKFFIDAAERCPFVECGCETCRREWYEVYSMVEIQQKEGADADPIPTPDRGDALACEEVDDVGQGAAAG